MAKKSQIYACEDTGLTIEVMGDADCTLQCCGKPMTLKEEQTADYTTEKHVPVVEGDENGVKVTVGSTLHPMTDEHYIQWIEVINGDYVNRKYLKPGDDPVAEFYVPNKPGLIVREYCNVHGLWRA